MTVLTERVEAAISDPTKVFDTPMQVVDDLRLTPDQKLHILQSWKKDAELLSGAQNENMTGGERPQLQDVSLALTRLEELSGLQH